MRGCYGAGGEKPPATRLAGSPVSESNYPKIHKSSANLVIRQGERREMSGVALPIVYFFIT